jgi:hypothetical protein
MIRRDGSVDGSDREWLLLNSSSPGCGGSLPRVSDLNCDTLVNGADLGQLLLQWGTCSGCTANFNCSGAVDGTDEGILLLAWGKPVRPVCSSGEGGSSPMSSGPSPVEIVMSPGFQTIIEGLLAAGEVETADELIVSVMEGGGQ